MKYSILLRQFRQIKFWDTFRLIQKGISSGYVYLKKNTFTDIHPSSRIIVQSGSLSINEKWSKKDPFPTLLFLGKNARLIVKNNFNIFSGSKVYINENAILKLGQGYINSNLNLSCFESIEIGEDVAISENVCIRDSDNHQITSHTHSKTKPIKIGNHVWIGMNVTILKGVTIGDGAIIAANSVVTTNIPEKSLAAGVPAKVIKEDVSWK